MKRTVMAAVACLLGASPTLAASASGHDALSLAARVGLNSPLLSADDKAALGVFLDGPLQTALQHHGKIVVKADDVVCKKGNVDLTRNACDLRFGKKTVTISGRDAQALYATMLEAGVADSGAAGTLVDSLSALTCTLDPTRFDAGGGAECAFAASP